MAGSKFQNNNFWWRNIFKARIYANQISICLLHKAIQILLESVLKHMYPFAGNITYSSPKWGQTCQSSWSHMALKDLTFHYGCQPKNAPLTSFHYSFLFVLPILICIVLPIRDVHTRMSSTRPEASENTALKTNILFSLCVLNVRKSFHPTEFVLNF